ncbi:hypothetical protein LQV63_30760 [Paenibacillus profundus]|uniref:ATP-grasp domain-containing protein n=1 Tax=Paenibacillus profundus TaxID=1173085 RepID=A0ABS8YP70_9BACL|nr:hypothetical protein [Paenibacillus profundus]MCE5173613.1 hypothetical protein [Paenibacillus profundus]
MQRKCFILPALRPHVQGTQVNLRPSLMHDEGYGRDIQIEQGSPAILIIASEEDRTALYFKKFVERNNCSVSLVSIEDSSLVSNFTWSDQDISRQGHFPGIYFRGASTRCAKLNRVLEIMQDVLAFYPGIIINRPSRHSLNYSKPLQMTAISRSIHQTVKPIPTFLSNVPAKIASSNETIVKSISSIRSEVVALTDARLLHGAGALHCPIQLQPMLQGSCIRAHVCGDTVHAAKIDGDAIDYRYGEQIKMTRYELPQDVAAWCIQAARREGLEFAGIDFIYDEAAQLFSCLEINPSPGYHFYEKRLVDSGEAPSISQWLLQRLLGND